METIKAETSIERLYCRNLAREGVRIKVKAGTRDRGDPTEKSPRRISEGLRYRIAQSGRNEAARLKLKPRRNAVTRQQGLSKRANGWWSCYSIWTYVVSGR